MSTAKIGAFGQRIEPKQPDCTCKITDTTEPGNRLMRTFLIDKSPCIAHSTATVIEGELA